MEQIIILLFVTFLSYFVSIIAIQFNKKDLHVFCEMFTLLSMMIITFEVIKFIFN